MTDDVRRVDIGSGRFSEVKGTPEGNMIYVFEDYDGGGTHALLPWEQYEHLCAELAEKDVRIAELKNGRFDGDSMMVEVEAVQGGPWPIERRHLLKQIAELKEALASRTAGFDALNEVRNTHSLVLAETKRIADEKIDRLERALAAMRDKLTETVTEKDKRIAELECDLCVLDNIINNAAALLDDGELSCEEAVEKAIKELDRSPRLESDRLYVELAEATGYISSLEAIVSEQKKRIAELEDKRYEVSLDEDQHIITDDQINALWKRRSFYSTEPIDDCIAALGIVACPKCGGAKRKKITVFDSGREFPDEIDCDCRHNGWVMEER